MAEMNLDIRVREIVEEYVVERKLDRMIFPYELSSSYDTDRFLKEEFKQELCIILLKYKNKEKLISMYERKELDFFIFGIIRNQLKSVNSPFWKTHNRWESNREKLNTNEEYE